MPVKKNSFAYQQEDWLENIITNIHNGEILDINKILPLITPGNELRRALDEILYGNLGALIVLGCNDKLKELMKGGIDLDIPFSYQKLFELSKMDGAIVLSSDLKKIIGANIHLMPDKSIKSSETGMRHRSAEQTAVATGLPTIAISHRRNVISLYYRDQKYVLQDLNLLIVKANHMLANLKDYREKIDTHLRKLLKNEFNVPSIVKNDVIELIQKILFFFRHKKQLDKLVVELGIQGEDISNSLYEITYGLEEELALILLDYSDKDISKEEALEKVNYLNQIGLSKIYDVESLSDICGISKLFTLKDTSKIYPRGYRVLSKIPKISEKVINDLINEKKSLYYIKNSSNALILIPGLENKTHKYILNQLNKLNEDVSENLFDF
jgi:diadenylate cyclase